MTTLADHPMPLRQEKAGSLGFFRGVVRMIEKILIGRVNWVGGARMLNGTTTTTVPDERVLTTSQITFMAEDAAGGAALAAVFVDQIIEQSGTTPGSFRINHADPGANAEIRYCIKG